MIEEKAITKSDLRETLKEVIEESYGGKKFKDAVEGVVENTFSGQKFKDAVENTFSGQKFKDSVEEVVMDAIAKFNTDDLKPQFDEIKTDIEDIKTEVKNVKSQMASKRFITEKVNSLSGEFIIKLKTEDEKIEKVTDKLGEKRVFNKEDIKEVKSVEIFPVLK